ncbi:MAG: preprotein translocase subunit SecY [Lachnospiraceae bacterium]|nr:preprotein translocase subunit SecY [Lachnospiraceae bacterium]
MFKTLRNAWRIEDIRKRILFTIAMIVVIRVGAQIPVPGTNAEAVKEIFASLQNDAFNIFNSFTGKSLENFSILALSITPYITSSIIIELLTIAIPKLEELQRDGQEGRKKITKYTRYLTVVLALIEGTAMSLGWKNLFTVYNAFYVIVCVVTLTAGVAFLMWVGEQITDKGVGNGISIVLVVNILAGIPEELGVVFTKVTTNRSIPAAVVLSIITVAFILAIVMFVVWLHGAQRKIPVQYSGRIRGRSSLGGQTSFIPLKVLTASVIPVIFASSLMSLPAMVAQFVGDGAYSHPFWGHVIRFLSTSYWFNFSTKTSWVYSFGVLLYLALIFVFAYFYTSITFNPIEVADNMKKQAGFIPGIRPGKPTSDYLRTVLNYIIFIGAAGLSIVALIPIIIGGVFTIGKISFLGTSLIIIVGVILETLQNIEGRMVDRAYDSIF